jgi:L-rhamnose mutarotase
LTASISETFDVPEGRGMIRKAFSMTLKPGNQDEYQRRHQPIWPELRKVLKEHGVSEYSIYLNRGTGQLFAYVEVESEESWQQIAQNGECRRWWAYMKDLMLTSIRASRSMRASARSQQTSRVSNFK